MSDDFNKSHTWRVGTRASLLAITQTNQLIDEMKKTFPQDKFELVTLTTQGDEQTEKALYELEGKDFFTKELDEALLEGKTDISVHSYKDLGSVRPEGIRLGAISKRAIANDVLLLKPAAAESLLEANQKKTLVIGTSSPRRSANLPECLETLFGIPSQDVTTKTLRGNVPTRLKKALSPDFDGVVLAAAGIERLLTGEGSRDISALLTKLEWCFLPQTLFPSAAAQGSLGVEYSESNPRLSELKQRLSSVHSVRDAECIEKERSLFQQRGGGCHLPVGIHVSRPKLNSSNGDADPPFFSVIERGVHEGEAVSTRKIQTGSGEIVAQIPRPFFLGLPPTASKRYQAQAYDELIVKTPIPSKNVLKQFNSLPLEASVHVLISSANAIDAAAALKDGPEKETHFWSAGTRSWRKATERGIWVRGCADGFGELCLSRFWESAFFSRRFSGVVLTARHAESSYATPIASYFRTVKNPSHEQEQTIQRMEGFFWSSPFQYQVYLHFFPEIEHKKHFCGPGKTWRWFRQQGVDVVPIASMNELKLLLDK